MERSPKRRAFNSPIRSIVSRKRSRLARRAASRSKYDQSQPAQPSACFPERRSGERDRIAQVRPFQNFLRTSRTCASTSSPGRAPATKPMPSAVFDTPSPVGARLVIVTRRSIIFPSVIPSPSRPCCHPERSEGSALFCSTTLCRSGQAPRRICPGQDQPIRPEQILRRFAPQNDKKGVCGPAPVRLSKQLQILASEKGQAGKVEEVAEGAAGQGPRGSLGGLGVHADSRPGEGGLHLRGETAAFMLGQRVVQSAGQAPVQPRERILGLFGALARLLQPLDRP